jgi:hypothetical protein
VMNEDQLLERAIACDQSYITHQLTNTDIVAPHEQKQDLKQKSTKTVGEDIDRIDLISSSADLKLDNHTIFIAKALQDEINSDSLLEEKILEIEKKIFTKLLAMPTTLAKIKKVI